MLPYVIAIFERWYELRSIIGLEINVREDEFFLASTFEAKLFCSRRGMGKNLFVPFEGTSER